MSRNKTTLINIICTIILEGVAFISGPIFSSMLGASNYGVYSVYGTWVGIAQIILSLQAGCALVQARTEYPEKEQEKYQSSAITLGTISYMVFSLLIIIAAALFRKSLGLSLVMVVLGLMQGWGSFGVGFANSKNTYEFRADKNLFLSVSTVVLTAAAQFILVYNWKSEDNYWGMIIGQSLVIFIFGLVIFIAILKRGRCFVSRKYYSFTLPITLPLIVHSLMGIILNQSDRIMLQKMVSNSSVGIYTLACTFASVINIIWTSLNRSWNPFYYEYMMRGQEEEIRRHSRNYLELYTIITMGFILLSREVFSIYASSEFRSGADALPLFAFGYFFIFLYSFATNYEMYYRKTKTVAVGTFMAALVNIVLNYVLIIGFGMEGAVIATLLSDVFLFVFHFINAKRLKEKHLVYRLRDFAPWTACVAISCVMFYLLKDMWLVRWGIGAVLGIYLAVKIVRRREIF